MKIIKFKKKNSNQYRITLDNGQELDLFEDIIVNDRLIVKKEISEKELAEIIKKNSTAKMYSECLKYIGIRIRSKKELKEYLKKKDYSENQVTNTIDRLIKEGLINDENFVKAFINDKLLMTNYGPYKIKNELLKHKIDETIIDKYIDGINNEDLNIKIDKIINKYIKANKKYSKYILKNKLKEYLSNLGYPQYLFINKLENINQIDEEELIKKEVIKEYNKLSKKYSDRELLLKLKQKLYQKGFKNVDIESILENNL